MAFTKLLASFTATSLFALIFGQRTPINEFPAATTFPNEQATNVTDLLTQAEHLATDPRIYQYFMDQCIVQQVFPELFSMPSAFVTPFRAFDNFYFVGHTGVSSWAYDTGDGLTIIDALNDQDEIDAVMLPMLAEFGFQGQDIKSVFITHEHLDHYGGARYLQDRFAPAVYASEAAWKAMAAMPANATPPVPRKDQTLVDGEDITLGKVTFHSVATPGHTLGCISLIFPVYDNGEAHMAGLSGGTGTPANATLLEMKVQSQNRFADIASDKGVDVLLSNHQVADHAVQNGDILAHRAVGEQHPFAVGVESFANYMKINALCSQVIAAREGQDLSVGNGASAARLRRDIGAFFESSSEPAHDCYM